MGRQTIVTKYLGPTNTKGGRIKAQCDAGSVTLIRDSALNSFANHARAAQALVDKLGWGWGRKGWIPGELPYKGSKFLYVFIDPKTLD